MEFTTWRAVGRPTQVPKGRGAKRSELRWVARARAWPPRCPRGPGVLGARNVAGQHVHPLTPAPNHTQITNPSPIQHTRAAERGAPCLAGRMTTIQPRWRTRKRPPPRKGSRREHECAGADGGAELPVSQAPQEEDDDDPDKVEDEEASANEEEESEGEHERHFGYNPDREVNVRVEYQAAMQDHVFAY